MAEDRIFTAFEVSGRLYHFFRIPFGVTNGGACFQRVMDSIISDERLSATFAYMDDVTICGRDQVDHDKNLARFHTAAEKFNLVFNPDKCLLSKSSVTLLGFFISNHQIKPDPERLKTLQDLPAPTTNEELIRVENRFAHYAKWISNFSARI